MNNSFQVYFIFKVTKTWYTKLLSSELLISIQYSVFVNLGMKWTGKNLALYNALLGRHLLVADLMYQKSRFNIRIENLCREQFSLKKRDFFILVYVFQTKYNVIL